ncbi:elongation factor Tu domain 2 [Leptospira interrogans str. UT126]|nr:elongation factor Tu domain 2 [Leptospira interrogans str. UT126]EMJ47804.1 elongation factor Tu domain 2 [Leptospira interrogans str. UT126]EMJ48583.1 elongation factor Tu domain 2 [Leptospira interrogans str. UT126]EMJ49466.1 elongation factor Tu domain 2 [Leptospira interrogans str. UT126]EMJ55114.1 elongation factor Tu domain 2 [Leptospira interrogans str. UT126]
MIRPLSDEHHDYRGYAGQVRSGIFRKGDSITVLPSGFTSTIESINTYDGEVEEAFPPMSITIRLKDEIDISRGDMIVLSESLPIVSQDLEANICWMDSKALLSGNKYILRQTTNTVKAIVKEIEFKVAPDTHEKLDASKGLTLNEIGKIKIRTAKPVSFDEYRINRSTGSFILVDEGTNSTVGAGMITGVGA